MPPVVALVIYTENVRLTVVVTGSIGWECNGTMMSMGVYVNCREQELLYPGAVCPPTLCGMSTRICVSELMNMQNDLLVPFS
jgi:hypothetical protein